MKHSTDYHDYVFKDGKIIGKFDDMYKYSKATPWRQDEAIYDIFSDIDMSILKQFKYSSVCDVGCGLGYFSDRLSRELESGERGFRPKVVGIDISKIAVERARKMFPKIRFITGNLIKERPLGKERFELVVIKDILWYVSHGLSRFFSNVTDMIEDGGFLFVSQSFPELDTWVGQDIIDCPETLKRVVEKHVEPVHFCVEWDWRYNARPLVHFLGKKTTSKRQAINRKHI